MMSFRLFAEATDPFDYDRLARQGWREKVKKEMGRTGIHFDLENDDRVADREIVVPQDFWDHCKCRFVCRMCVAGGDWETPVIYFQCQLKEGYAKDLSKKDLFVVIPGKEGGNPHLVKDKRGLRAPHDGEPSQGKRDEKAAWAFLRKHLEGLVRAEIEKVKSSS